MTPASPLTAATDDFGDWPGAFLVKEMRQSLRSRQFQSLVLWIQGSMTLITAMHLLDENESHGAADVYYWGNMVLVLHVLLPFRHLMGGDPDWKKANCDLIFMTSQSGLRALLGKWLGTALLTLMIALTLVPYQIIRSYSGGVDLAGELIALAFLTLMGALFSLWGVFAASFAPVIRMLLFVLMLPVITFTDVGGIFAALSEDHGGSDGWLMVGNVYLVIFVLSICVVYARFESAFTQTGTSSSTVLSHT